MAMNSRKFRVGLRVRTSVNLSPHLPTFSKAGEKHSQCSHMVLQVDVGYCLLLVLKTETT